MAPELKLCFTPLALKLNLGTSKFNQTKLK